MNKLSTIDFSLEHTIESGQFFTYEFRDSFYYIVHKETVFKVRQEKDILFYDGISEKELVDFFDLETDFKELTCDFKEDKYLLLALEKYYGLRIIKQDLWQCIVGFVCSSCSNIPKIKKNLYLISKGFGNKVIFDKKTFYTFPKIGTLNDLEKLKLAKTGFRAKYLYEINKAFTKEPHLINDIKNANYKTAMELLTKFRGIGSKVANCICLFALGHEDSFPIDTWIKKILEELYLQKKVKNVKELEEFVQTYFGKNKGLKQQYLFHYMRNSRD